MAVEIYYITGTDYSHETKDQPSKFCSTKESPRTEGQNEFFIGIEFIIVTRQNAKQIDNHTLEDG